MTGAAMELDERDAALLAALQADARQTNRRLAERLGIAPSTCLERVRALQARGVITGFHATVSLPAIGRGLQALLSVQVRPMSREVITGFKQFAIALPEVIAVMVVTGSDDFLVHVAVRDVESLHA